MSGLWLWLACQVGRVSELEAQLSELQATHDSLLVERDTLHKKIDICRGDPTEIEAAAVDLHEAVIHAHQQWDMEAARESLAQLREFYPNTNAGRVIERLTPALDVIGEAAPPLDNVTWLNTPGAYGELTVVYFLEEWCPFCRDELPQYTEKAAEFKERGVQVIGLTEISRTSTLEKLNALLEETGTRFPVGQVADRTLHDAYNVEGIPAAAVVVDGTIVWRGGARQLNWERIEQQRTQ